MTNNEHTAFLLSKLRRTRIVAAIAALIAVIFALLWVNAQKDLSKAQDKIDSQSERLMEYASMDDRQDAMRRGATLIRYQEWAEQQPRFVEHRHGTICIVERSVAGKFGVTKSHVGSQRVFFAEFTSGGPDACDRIQLGTSHGY